MQFDQNVQGLVVFRHLTIKNIWIALLLRAWGRRIVYIEALGYLRTESWKSRLGRIGLNWVDCGKLEGLDYGRNVRTTAAYATYVVGALISDCDIFALTHCDPMLTGRTKSIRALVYSAIAAGIAPYSYAYGLAEYFRERGIRADVYQKLGISHVYLETPGLTDVQNYYTRTPFYLLHCAFRSFFSFSVLTRFILGILPRQKPDLDAPSIELIGGACGKVLYFPHLGVSYNQLYQKDQYYSDDPKSLFHVENIVHVEFGWMVPDQDWGNVKHSYDYFKVTPVVLAPVGSEGFLTKLRNFTELVSGLDGRYRALRAVVLYSAKDQFLQYKRVLSPLRKARLALIGYDMLFPVAAAIALRSWGIRTVATQERFIQPFYGNYSLSLDTYFVQGEFTKKHIETNPVMDVPNTVVIGDVRVKDIEKHRELAQREREIRFGAFDRVCLILDYQTRPDHHLNSYYFWLGPEANQLFYDHVLDLARTYPECAFIIRGKNTDWINDRKMSLTRSAVESETNIFIDTSTSAFGRAQFLAAMSDIVVARHTSLCDQCLSIGIPVLVDESLPNGGRLISTVHDYEGYSIMVENGEELKRQFGRVLEGAWAVSPEKLSEMQKHYYGHDISDSKMPHERLAVKLEALLKDPPIDYEVDHMDQSNYQAQADSIN